MRLFKGFNPQVFFAVFAALLLTNCSTLPNKVADYKAFIDSKVFSDSYKSAPQSKYSRKYSNLSSVKIRKGDSVSKIAKRYNVKLKDLIAINGLKHPYKLIAGKNIKMPQSRSYKVKRGDFLSKIAKRYNVNTMALARANGLRKPYVLEIGQRLKIPYASPYKIYAKSKTKSRKVAKKKYRKSAKKHASRKSKSSRKRSLGRFIWPAKGRIIAKYGSKRGGEFNDGINIAAREGSKIRASENGSVVYIGNELKGYGNLIIIRHSGGWLTAYAHNKKFAVKKGDKVKKGQTIAYVGKTGNVSRPQVHFAIRKGRNAVDPLKYLAS